MSFPCHPSKVIAVKVIKLLSSVCTIEVTYSCLVFAQLSYQDNFLNASWQVHVLLAQVLTLLSSHSDQIFQEVFSLPSTEGPCKHITWQNWFNSWFKFTLHQIQRQERCRKFCLRSYATTQLINLLFKF